MRKIILITPITAISILGAYLVFLFPPTQAQISPDQALIALISILFLFMAGAWILASEL